MRLPGIGSSGLRALLALGAFTAVASGVGCSSGGDDPAPYTGPGCAVPEAEHPAYTTVARDVALCGNNYDTTNIATACDSHFHVCRETEWHSRFPAGVDPAGTLATWGVEQATRCVDVWQANQPTDATVWSGDVCNSAYNPWNTGKFLFADDGTTILQGSGSCCGWDSTFDVTAETQYFAVYCCKD